MMGRTVSRLVEVFAGCMSVFYKAEDITLQRFAALKFLPDDAS